MSEEFARRWRLVLGAEGDTDSVLGALEGEDRARDVALDALYGTGRSGDLGGSSPYLARWLGDIRACFPRSAVQMMQRDAVERLHLHKLLLEPELLEAVEPDVHLVANLLSMARLIPAETKDTARRVVRKVVQDVERRLRDATAEAVRGAVDPQARSRRPRASEIDWARTIRRNLRNYLPEQGILVPEVLVGRGRRRSSLHDIVLCVDQSGSMASSVVYAGIFGAVLASLRATRTRMVVFDTEVVDLTEDLDDPVDLLFGCQLGGGTDIHRALAYCQGLVERPSQTVLVLITDLYEGGDRARMLRRAAALVHSGVQVICLLALNDDGAPGFDARNAAALAALGVPTFACTPDQFPDLIATALKRGDIAAWAARHDVALLRGDPG
jgi:Mg-chelatase subunit ChlD